MDCHLHICQVGNVASDIRAFVVVSKPAAERSDSGSVQGSQRAPAAEPADVAAGLPDAVMTGAVVPASGRVGSGAAGPPSARAVVDDAPLLVTEAALLGVGEVLSEDVSQPASSSTAPHATVATPRPVVLRLISEFPLLSGDPRWSELGSSERAVGGTARPATLQEFDDGAEQVLRPGTNGSRGRRRGDGRGYRRGDRFRCGRTHRSDESRDHGGNDDELLHHVSSSVAVDGGSHSRIPD